MKKLLFLCLLSAFAVNAQTTATNFTVNDCAGNPHNLFNDLDAGKVVVISWVMPCASCIGPVLAAQNEIQNHLVTNPGKILFYIVDDFGQTNCTTLNNWCSTNSITAMNAVFKNSAIDMMDYGSTGMPKTIIVAGPNHQVFFNQDDDVTVSNFNSAMTNALAAAVGVKEQSKDLLQFSVSPNPANSAFSLNYQAKDTKAVNIDIYNSLGQKVRTLSSRPVIGENSLMIKTEDLPNGAYFVKINDNATTKIIVSH